MTTTPHRRRPRYAGTHPTRFDQKYKEHAPDRYPELVQALRARGRTPAGQHVPIMVDELLEVLTPRPGDRVVDATLGWGGHAEHMLPRILPGGILLGLDVDPLELPKTTSRLRQRGWGEDAFITRRANFAGLGAAVSAVNWDGGADVVYADLGVSSMQIDDPSRGFSFTREGPLDMRMNPSRGLPAAEWLARVSRTDLAEVLTAYADEPLAEPIADVLTSEPCSIRTTADLARVVRLVMPGRSGDEAAATVRRVFQAIRIAVNDELGALDALLRALPHCLRPGGRVAILTFHSGEDRRVKHAFADGLRAGTYAEVSRDVVRASLAERRANPRAAAAKLRWARL